MIDELSALKSIRERFRNISDMVEIGIGDDCAAVRFSQGNLVLATTDSQVEDVHFLKRVISPSDLARRAVAVSVSDIAAMGGVPRYILASVGFSKDEDEEYLNNLMSGFEAALEEFGVSLIGGNLTASEKMFIDITVLGEAEPGSVVKRSGAKPGDLIYVSGTLGDSALGLKLIQGSQLTNEESGLVARYLRPEPRLSLGRELARAGLASAMIDVSDGLLLDLERITTMQGVGACVDRDRIPVSDEYGERVSGIEDDYYGPALSGGEDYELLFTSDEGNRERIGEMSGKLGIKITEIGYTVPEIKITLSGSDIGNSDAVKTGFVHFRA